MAGAITFYFDFSSPYAFLASERIDAIAEHLGRPILWKPVLLGATFKATGGQPLLQIPMKGDYARLDLERSARQYGISYHLPSNFPFASIAPSRAVYWTEERHPEKTTALVHALFRAAWQQDRDIAASKETLAVAAEVGLEEAALAEGLKDPAIKERLRREVDESLEKGIFGAPYMLVDGEAFWGNDRLETLAAWVSSGGW